MRFVQFVPVFFLGAMVLSGCKKPDVIPTAPPSAPVESAPSTAPAPSTNVDTGDADRRALEELKRIGTLIYFDYDRAEIKSEFVPIVAAHAKYLNGNTARKVRLEGHSDERGSREYNIGLGERRAQAVRRALLLQGVGESQLTTVSYGEERPAAQGSDETAYSRNRRVELVYGQ